MCLGVHGCSEPSGGAVELSWALRSTLDRAITDCADTPIKKIRLQWDDGMSPSWHSFPCDDNHGVTAFNVPTGAVALSIAPECQDGALAVPESYQAPPPIVRDVVLGQAVTLDALLLVVRVDDPAAPGTGCVAHPCVCAP